MGDDDDMVKEAVCLGGTMEWSEDGPWTTARSKTRAFTVCVSWEWRAVEVSPRRRVQLWRRKENGVTVRNVSAELSMKHRAAVAPVEYLAQDRLDLGVAAVDLAKNHGSSERG